MRRPAQVEILAVQRAQLADAQPDEHQRREYDGPRDVVAVALRRVDPDLTAADLGDERVRHVVAACERDVGIAAGADGVNVVPAQAAARLLKGGARVEQRGDLEGLDETALRPVFSHERVRIVGHVAFDHAMANAVSQDLAHGPDDLVDRAVGQSATATLTDAPGALVEIVLDQCAALGGGLGDRVALAQHGVDHVVEVTGADLVDRLVAEMLDRVGEPPVEVLAALVGSHPPFAPVKVPRRGDLEGLGLGRGGAHRRRG